MKKLISMFLLVGFFDGIPQLTLAFDMTQDIKSFTIRPQYYGARNQEATYELIADILVITSKKEVSLKELNQEVAGLYKYVLGQMRRTPGNPAASYPKYSIELLQSAPEKEGVVRATIKMRAKGVFRKDLESYNFYVPIEQSKLWTQAKNLCAYDVGVDSGNFWYHWEPRKSDCPLIQGVHYNVVTAKLKYIPSTILTFPEYDNFARTDNTLKVTYMFGLESYTDNEWDANSSGDWGAIWYRQTRDYLVMNFDFKKRAWSDSEIADLIGYDKPADGKNWPTIEDYTLDTLKGQIRFRLFLGVTGLYNESTAFHKILQESLFNENVVFYSGHSGIGKNVDINKIEKLRGSRIPLSRNYQIYFWGGCVPYSYYTDMFFMRKQNLTDPQGTEKLDIIAYGNESVFTANDDQRLILALVNYMTDTKLTSYQEIIGDQDRYFFGVNGDEDNPTALKGFY